MAKKFVDPFEMDINNDYIQDNLVPTTATVLNNARAPVCSTENANLAGVYYKRILNMILNDVNYNKVEDLYTGKISVTLSTDDYKLLQKQIESGISTEGQYKDIDNVLTNSCQKSIVEDMTNLALSWQESLYITVTSPSFYIILACIFVLFMGVKLYRAKFSSASVIKVLFLIGFIIDFLFTWMKLYQKEDINRYVDRMKWKNIPDHCDPDKITVLQMMWQAISGADDCKQYHQDIHSDVIWIVGPLTVFTEQFSAVSQCLGNSVGHFSRGIMSSLPWGVGAILLPLILLFVAIIGCILLSFITKTGVEINLFHLLKLNFGKHQHERISNSIPDLLENRKFIEEVILNTKEQIEGTKEPCADQQSATNKSSLNKPISNETEQGKATSKDDINRVMESSNVQTVDNFENPIVNENGSGDNIHISPPTHTKSVTTETNNVITESKSVQTTYNKI